MNRYLVDVADQHADRNRADRQEYRDAGADVEPEPLPTMRDLIDLPEWQLQRIGYVDPFLQVAPSDAEPF